MPLWFAVGWIAAATLVLTGGELFLRAVPPTELYAYLGESSPLTGPYVPDPTFGVTYRSWDVFSAENAEHLRDFGALSDSSGALPIWAFFGNSFVQAPGMLADVARTRVRTRRIFNLGRNEPLPVRLAQIRLLLDHGLHPERIFVELMPVDLLLLGEQPLATTCVTSKGALTYEPRLPAPPADWLVGHSALLRTAWFRTGRHRGNPRFNKHTLYERIDEPLLSDVRHLFAGVARSAQAHDVPVTVVLIPSYHQVLFGASYGFQDTMTAVLHAQGFDVLDPRDAFAKHPTPATLFIPDKHLSDEGNALLLTELLNHVHAREASPGAL